MEANFTYESQKFEPIHSQPRDKIRDICESFCSKNGIDFEKAYFEIEGFGSLEKVHYNKPLSWFVCGQVLNITVKTINDSERNELNTEENIEVIFSFNLSSTNIECTLKSQILDVCESFAYKINKDLNSLDFFYNNNKLDLSKTFCEIAEERDIKKRKIKIIVKEKEKEGQTEMGGENKQNEINLNNNINLSGDKDRSRCNSDCNCISKDCIYKYCCCRDCSCCKCDCDCDCINKDCICGFFKICDCHYCSCNCCKCDCDSISDCICGFFNIFKCHNCNCSCCDCDCIKGKPLCPCGNACGLSTGTSNICLLFTIIFGLIGIIIILIIFAVTFSEEAEKTKETEEDVICLEFSKENKDICILCKEDYELFKGKCISYAFNGTYQIDSDDEIIEIFYPNFTNPIVTIKINDTFIEPSHELNLTDLINLNDITYTTDITDISDISDSTYVTDITDITDINEITDNINSSNISIITIQYYLEENTDISLSKMFKNNRNLVDISFNNKHMDKYKIKDMNGMFNGCSSLKNISLYLSNGKDLTDISNLFSGCTSLISAKIEILNSNNIKYMNNLFYNCFSIKNIQIINLNTNNVIDMYSIFYNCISLNSLDISVFNFQNAINISRMFYNCSSLKTLDLNSFNIQNALDMSEMFFNCTSLEFLNTVNFYTLKVVNMSNMFYNCESLVSLNLQNFKTQDAIDIHGMFYNCNSLIFLNIYSFNTQNVTNMESMFYNCISLQSLNISRFNTENAINMNSMFYNCHSLTSLNISNFNNSNALNMEHMFYNCYLLNYTDISNLIFNKNISLFSELPEYCTVIMHKNSINKIYTIPKTCNLFAKDDRGIRIHNSTSNWLYYSCIEDFDLYKGECISYAFYATYNITNFMKTLTLFNPLKTNNLFALKVNYGMVEPNSEFNNIVNNRVYYYLYEKLPIDLSYFFENINQLINFSFNDKYMENFNIKFMQRMFSGCISLKSISIQLLNNQNLSDISYLFQDALL